MAVAQTLSFDLFLQIAQHLGCRDLLNLGTTQQVLAEPLTRRAFTVALTVPFDHDLKPVTYAIITGDTQLLSKAIGFLDVLFPAGPWQWSRFYSKGVGSLLTLAAAHNLESLLFLLNKYPLMPEPDNASPIPANLIPAPILAHGFYSVENSHDPALVNVRNRELVKSALEAGRLDCASVLLNYQPSLFPNGFPLNNDPICYSSATMLTFLVDHGAYLGSSPLHDAAALASLPDTRVFDMLVQMGFDVNSPLDTFRHSPMGLIFTPLHEACRWLQPERIEALLRLGANPNGITSNFWIKKVPIMSNFQYFTPIPLLMLLLSTRWDLTLWGFLVTFEDFGRRFLGSFQSLVRYGAITSIPYLQGCFLEILLLRIWRILYKQITRQPNLVLPSSPNMPRDLNHGVRSLLLAISNADVSPWDHVCQVVSDANPMWSRNVSQTRGKERLIRLLVDYQERFRDLPGPAQLRDSFLFELPRRYTFQLAIAD
ncbi:hypothetical protein F4803DRAFT_513290 [Xylaria telfairii]|nr:hypothetical protein F4803DRAFT_513290 [Xylaria telfairii]